MMDLEPTERDSGVAHKSTAWRVVVSGGFMLMLFAVLISLGIWQLDRAAQKRVRAEHYAERMQSTAVGFDQVSTTGFAELKWRRVNLFGTFEKPTILLDNRVRRGRYGYEVISPLRIDNGERILVNRGWTAASYERSEIPDIEIPTERIQVVGHLGELPVTGLRMSGAADRIERFPNGTLRVQRVDPGKLADVLSVKLASGMVYLDQQADYGYDRNWAPPGDGSAKHRAYAIQWFSMAAILVGIAAWQFLKWRRQ